jgi:hypothetical protein
VFRRNQKHDDPVMAEYFSLPTGRSCPRCNGERHADNVTGGWLPHFRNVAGAWYTFARACPDCTWGAYRARCTKAPYYDQTSGNTLELGMLHSALTRGRSMRQSVETLPGPVKMRLLPAVDALEATEQGWRQYTQPELPVAAGNIKF